MGLFKRRKKEEDDEYDIFTSEIPVSTMVRWFIYDIGYGDTKVDEELGLAPMSEEGEGKEEQDSKKRLEELYPLIPYMDFMSDACANVFTIVASNMDKELTEEEREEMEDILGNLYKSVALSAIVGAFSVANSLGLIDITAFSAKLKDMGDMLDE